MNNARIIRLDKPITVKAMNFEDVYQEYSFASGKRKQTKAEKTQAKIEKIEAKKAIKAAKQERRKARLAGRQETKETRIAKRQGAQQARQAKKTAATQARQERRTIRKTAKVERKAIGQPEDAMQEQEMDENLNTPSGNETPVAETEENVADTTSQNGEATEESTEETGESGENTEEAPEESTEDGSEEDSGEQEETESFVGVDGYYDFFTGEGLKNNAFNNESLGSVEDIYALQPDDFYTYSNGTPDSNFDGTGSERFRINPKVLNAAMKSEWNKEKVCRLKINLDAIEKAMAESNDGEQARVLGIKKAKTKEAMELHKARASSFDAMLSNYAGFDGLTVIAPSENFTDGTYDDASTIGTDDIMSYADGRKPKKVSRKKTMKAKKVANVAKKKKISKKELGRRRAETRAAIREARKSRLRSKGLVKKSKADSFISKLKESGSAKKYTPSVTEIEQGLNPQISKNRIVIPPRGLTESELTYSAEGTGLIAIDNAEDYDAPTGIMYENFSGADGSKYNVAGIVMGVAVAGLAIWAVKKYKLI